jgi:polysaccharide export outer membrane protein
VRESGQFPISEGLSLNAILAVAGGLALEANTSNIEVTSAHNGPNTTRTHINFREDNPKDIIIGPGDSVRVNQKFEKIADKSVLIMGEVHHPGRYDLIPGDKIADLIERAGGLTDQSYAYGAIFSRQSERRAEEARFKSQAKNIELSIAAALEADDEKVNAGKIAEARSLAAELRSAQGVGRITVEADPAVLTVQPELDMLLESGDRLFIPKRGLTVRVSGEALSPASLQFRENKASLDYIHEAGGFTFHADKDRTFVIYPDGSAQPLAVNTWNYKPVKVPPGSTIVVPRDPKPFDFIQSAKDVSQILSNLAVTAIFIDNLQDD